MICEPEVLARRIASFGLPNVPQPEGASLADDEWLSLFKHLQDQRITGLAVESMAAGWLELTSRQIEELLAAHRDAMMWSLSIEGKLVGLADAFHSEGIIFAVLKGTSVARTAYPEPCLRSFGDLDLLVRTVDYERACALLGRLGHVRRRPEPRPGFEMRFGKASVHSHPDDGIEVDLHRTLVLGPFGLWMRPEELLERSETFTLAGRRIGRLDDTGMLLNVAVHASLGRRPPQLVPLRDVLQVSAFGDVDWPTLGRWAARWQLAAVLQHAFTEASRAFDSPVPDGASTILIARASRRELRALDAYTGERRDRGGMALSTLRALPRAVDKARYVRALTFPEPAFLAARAPQPGQATYRRRLKTPIRWAIASLRKGPPRDDHAMQQHVSPSGVDTT